MSRKISMYERSCSVSGSHVRYLADIPTTLTNVCFQGKNGHGVSVSLRLSRCNVSMAEFLPFDLARLPASRVFLDRATMSAIGPKRTCQRRCPISAFGCRADIFGSQATLRLRRSRIANSCPLLGVKRTCQLAGEMSAYDPKRTSCN